MDQDRFDTNRTCASVSEAATLEVVRVRDAKGYSRAALVRRVERHDPQFSATQFWRIQTGKSPWTLDRFVFVAKALGLDPPMLLDRILRGYDIQDLVEDGPEDADGATPTSSGPGEIGGSHPAVPGRSAAEPDGDD